MRTLVLSIPLLSLAMACGNEPTEELSLCFQTYEFGNTGCADVVGAVTDVRGSPVPGAYVGVTGSVDPARAVTLSSGSTRTDSTGRYSERVIRFDGAPPAEGPDTVSVWVRAFVAPAPEVPPGTPGPIDSVIATLEFRPVGQTPLTTEVVTIVVPDP